MRNIDNKIGAIIGAFEDLLDDKDIDIPNEEREEGNEEQAIIYGSDYDRLVNDIKEILKGQKWYIYRMFDDDDFLAYLKSTADKETFMMLVTEYKRRHPEDYDTDGLVSYIRNAGFKAVWIRVEDEVYF